MSFQESPSCFWYLYFLWFVSLHIQKYLIFLPKENDVLLRAYIDLRTELEYVHENGPKLLDKQCVGKCFILCLKLFTLCSL